MRTCTFVVTYRDLPEGDNLLRHYQHLTARLFPKDNRPKDRVTELLKYKGHTDTLAAIQAWDMPKCPVNGLDLQKLDLRKGPVFAKLLNEVREKWIESDFQSTQEELIEMIPGLLKDIKS